ncbi:nucleoside triphosphate pyrophosphohydrolase [bacterium]|nr:MAG: nucleoside triphosphate pyrophosphohydrolase [bacterium]
MRRAGIFYEVADSVPDGATLVTGPSGPVYELAHVIDRLLSPDGCPWDREQTHASLRPHLLEEAYEVADAIDSGDPVALVDELGDVLLQPFLHGGIAEGWDIDDVARGLVAKLVRRHPHVFGEAQADDPDAVLRQWEAIKREEKRPDSALSGVTPGLPSLTLAMKISKKAAKLGFEWPNVEAVLEKLDEERAELAEAIADGDAQHVADELADLLFTVVNVARWLKIDPEHALRRMVGRFQARFLAMERLTDQPLESLSAEEWDTLWTKAKELTA